METSEKKSIVDSIIKGAHDAIGEIEALRVQVALGTAEAKDLYEETKKKFYSYIQEAKTKFNTLKNKEDVIRLMNTFEFLQVQLALGKAETKEVFEEQEKKIIKALNKLERDVKGDERYSEAYARIHLEIEKFKIKLQLLGLHYELKKIKTEYSFEQKKKEFLSNLSELKTRMLTKKEKDNWEHFKEEIQEAYSHLKNAFTN